MWSVLAHVLYAAIVVYGYKAVETYQTQKALGIPTGKAVKSALVWPKYLF